jgi:hypothetical protein
MDNAPDVYAMASGSGRCASTQSVINSALCLTEDCGVAGYYTYVATTRKPADCLTRLEKIAVLMDELNPTFVEKPVTIPWHEYKRNFEKICNVRPTKVQKLS